MSSPVKTGAGIEPALLLQVKGKSPVTQGSYRRAAALFVGWTKGRAITVELFRDWIRAETRRVGAAAVLQEYFGVKAALLQAAAAMGMPERDMAVLKTAIASVPKPKTGRPEITVISPEERAKLFKALPLHVGLIARFLYATAARVSEATAVRERDLRIVMDTVHVRLLGKGGKEREVKIPLSLLSDINGAYAKPGRQYLFESSEGHPYCRQWISVCLAEVSQKVLGRSISAHDLRHSRATDLYEKTKNIKGVQGLLGHSSVATTAAYYVRSDLTREDLFEGEAI